MDLVSNEVELDPPEVLHHQLTHDEVLDLRAGRLVFSGDAWGGCATPVSLGATRMSWREWSDARRRRRERRRQSPTLVDAIREVYIVSVECGVVWQTPDTQEAT
jgi:hypothetical protein